MSIDEKAPRLVHDSDRPTISLATLFRIFLMAGLTFGGGLAIVAVLERELIRKRNAIARDDFLTYYALARVVPTGTHTALAVSLGNHFAGLGGAVVAMAGLLTPVIVATIALVVALTSFESATAMEVLPRTVLPAAMALIAVGAVSLSRDQVGLKRETLLAAAALLAALFLDVSPGILLLIGGLVGILVFRNEGGERGPEGKR